MSFRKKALLALAATTAGCATSRGPLASRPPEPVPRSTIASETGPGERLLSTQSPAFTPPAGPITLTSGEQEQPPIEDAPLQPPAPDDPTKPLPDAETIAFSNLPVQPIDLGTALALTGGRSPQVMFAQARIAEAQAQLERAEIFWVPSIRFGLNYNKHDGRIQDVVGDNIETSRGAFYTGLGANAVGAGSPTVPGLFTAFHTTDAIFQPRILSKEACARQFATRAALNDALLQTAIAYQDLLRTAHDLAIVRQAEARSAELARVTGEFARTGQGLESDADRAQTDLSLRRGDVLRSEEAFAVASARLSELVRWDLCQQLVPAEATIVPIDLASGQCDRQSLVATGLRNRPEISEQRYLVCAACDRLERERNAPLLPSVLLGTSYGGFGAGTGGNSAGNFGDRFDFDAVAFWEVRNLGFGEAAARDEASSRVQQLRSREIATLDRVAREIVEAHAQVSSRRQQIQIAQDAVASAQASYDRNIQRIENGQGLPIEVLQAIQALQAAQREYLRAVADYNTAQFTLQRALGWPISR